MRAPFAAFSRHHCPCPLCCSDAYLEAQRAHRWDMQVEEAMQLDNADVRVGIMGLGACTRTLVRGLRG